MPRDSHEWHAHRIPHHFSTRHTRRDAQHMVLTNSKCRTTHKHTTRNTRDAMQKTQSTKRPSTDHDKSAHLAILVRASRRAPGRRAHHPVARAAEDSVRQHLPLGVIAPSAPGNDASATKRLSPEAPRATSGQIRLLEVVPGGACAAGAPDAALCHRCLRRGCTIASCCSDTSTGES